MKKEFYLYHTVEYRLHFKGYFMKSVKLNKIGSKIKAPFSWDNIGKVVDSEGGKYTLKKVNNNEVRLTGKNQNHILPIKLVFSLVDIYDKQGNKINDRKDYD